MASGHATQARDQRPPLRIMQHVFYNSHCALVAARLKQRHPRSGWSGPDRIAATVEASGAFRSNDPSKLDG